MCGIAGIIHPYTEKYKPHLEKMLYALRHRGPDGEGVFTCEDALIAHRRLAVLDIENGTQPMLSKDKLKAVSFNGEIYGFRELKKKTNYTFHTDTDTELLLALYEKYGENLCEHLPGVFAFSIWDDEKKQLLLARDRLGEKPLYYAYGDEGTFLFASEIKGIIASGLVSPKLDMHSVAHYLRRLYVHPHKCIYENIYVLPPGHFLVYKNGEVRLKKYWQMPDDYLEISTADAYEKFEDLFTKSLQKQLVADVEIGALLSGGIDSSSVVAVASSQQQKLKTFSYGFEGTLSELQYAQQVSRLFSTEHFVLESRETNVAEMPLQMSHIYDEPFADSSNIPFYLLCRHASDKVKVVLSGDGGDELLGGYEWYKNLFTEKKQAFLFTLFSGLLTKKNNSALAHRHHEQNIYFNDAELKILGLDIHGYDVFQTSSTADNTLRDAQKMDMENYLPGDILTKTDRASMANGLEVRAPFLDIDLVEYCLQLPNALIADRHHDKKILRHIFKEKLPAAILHRPKQGFGAPVKNWLQQREVQTLVKDFLMSPSLKINSLLNKEKVAEIAGWNNYKTWQLLVFSIFLEQGKTT